MRNRQEQAITISELITYPRAKRIATLVMQIFCGFLFGAGIVIEFMSLMATAHFLILGALVLGGLGYSIKAMVTIYQLNRREKKLTEEVNQGIIESADTVANFDFNKCQQLVADLVQRPEHFTQLQIEKLYAHLCQLEKAVSGLKPYFAAKTGVSGSHHSVPMQQLAEWKVQVAAKRNPALQNAAPNQQYYVGPKSVRLVYKPHQGALQKTWVVLKKLGNRALSFVGGASMGTTFALGVVSFLGALPLLSNPIGWAMLGTVGFAVAMGLLAIWVEFVVLRKQVSKIEKLQVVKESIGNFQMQVGQINTAVNEMLMHANLKTQYSEMQLANTLLLEQNLILSNQVKGEKLTLQKTVSTSSLGLYAAAQKLVPLPQRIAPESSQAYGMK